MTRLRALVALALATCAPPPVQRYTCTYTYACDGPPETVHYELCGSNDAIQQDVENTGTICVGLGFLDCGAFSCAVDCEPTGDACVAVDGGQ